MYKLLFALLMTVGMTTAMCAQQNKNMNLSLIHISEPTRRS